MPDSIEYLDPESINGLNLYVYCSNNPINNYDFSIHNPDSILKTLLGVVVGIGLVIVAVGAIVASGGTYAFAGFKLGKNVSNKILNINTNLGIGDYSNIAIVDGAGFLFRSSATLISKIYTMGPTIVTGVGKGVKKLMGNYMVDYFNEKNNKNIINYNFYNIFNNCN